MAELKLFFDGGCRPNPGPIEVAVFTRGKVWRRDDLGDGSNDDAEWFALLYALDIAAQLGAERLLLLGDSALVVSQASGATRPRSPNLQAHKDRFCEKARQFAGVRLRHVRRSHNLAGIALDQARRRS